jgi:hypothetical protein
MMAAGLIGTDCTRVLLGAQGTLGVVGWASIYCQRLPEREDTRERDEVLLHVGGSNAFGIGQQAQLQTLVRLLRAAAVDFGIAFDADNDAGGLAWVPSRRHAPCWARRPRWWCRRPAPKRWPASSRSAIATASSSRPTARATATTRAWA